MNCRCSSLFLQSPPSFRSDHACLALSCSRSAAANVERDARGQPAAGSSDRSKAWFVAAVVRFPASTQHRPEPPIVATVVLLSPTLTNTNSAVCWPSELSVVGTDPSVVVECFCSNLVMYSQALHTALASSRRGHGHAIMLTPDRPVASAANRISSGFSLWVPAQVGMAARGESRSAQRFRSVANQTPAPAWCCR